MSLSLFSKIFAPNHQMVVPSNNLGVNWGFLVRTEDMSAAVCFRHGWTFEKQDVASEREGLCGRM